MDKFIDIHSHILTGVDDGPQDIKDSIKILHTLEKYNFKGIVLTSHYIEHTSYNANVIDRKKILNRLQKETSIKLFLGNEILICDNILQLIKKKEIYTLNCSRYLLIEFPFDKFNDTYIDILNKLINCGGIPIIAHPERYPYMDRELMRRLFTMGCLFQCNVASLSKKYGPTAKKRIEYMLKNDYVACVGTDIHKLSHIKEVDKGYKRLAKLVDRRKFKILTLINPYNIIYNKEIIM